MPLWAPPLGWWWIDFLGCLGNHLVQGRAQGGYRTLRPPWQRPHIQVAIGGGVSATVVAFTLRRPRGLGTGWSVRMRGHTINGLAIITKPTVDLVVLTLRP